MALEDKNYQPEVMAGADRNMESYGESKIVAGAVTINAQRGTIQTAAAITTATTSTLYTFDFVNNRISGSSTLMFTVANRTGVGDVVIGRVVQGTGSATVGLADANIEVIATGSVQVQFVVIN